MLDKDINAPPIVAEVAGGDIKRIGIAAQAYYSLLQMYARGENGDLRENFIRWLGEPNHSWLEAEPKAGDATPLAKLRLAVEKEKQRGLGSKALTHTRISTKDTPLKIIRF